MLGGAGHGNKKKKGWLYQVRLQHNAITTHSHENCVSEGGDFVFKYNPGSDTS